jgi:hypothetical protein
MRPRRRASDEAVSEVIGYVLMLFLSSAVLVLSMQAFLTSRAATQELQAATEIRLVSDRVASEVLQAGIVAHDMPNATYEATVKLPALQERAYWVNASNGKVYANTTDTRILAESDLYQVEALKNLQVHGTVYGAQGYLKVKYSKWTNGWRTIELTV